MYALYPIAVFSFPDVILPHANPPNAIFPLPVVFEYSVRYPFATL